MSMNTGHASGFHLEVLYVGNEQAMILASSIKPNDGMGPSMVSVTHMGLERERG
jgi:hypothetical protein